MWISSCEMLIRVNRVLSPTYKGLWKCSWKCADVPRNSPTFHTCAEGDHLLQGRVLHPSEQFYMHKNTFASVLIVWELIEVRRCIVTCLKRALKVLWNVRTRWYMRNSPTFHTCAEGDHLFLGQVYIPVNSSICIRTLPQVYSSCES